MKRLTTLILAIFMSLGATLAPAFSPNDPLYPVQWNFWAIGMGQAWDFNLGGSPEVTLAVVDTGVAHYTRDFAQTRFAKGYDFWNQDADPYDDNGHGSMIAGIMAQSTDNSMGASGMAFNCTILPVKVFDEHGGTGGAPGDATAVQGIDYAVAQGADIIDLSMLLDWSYELEQACLRAYEAGVMLVAAAGNNSRGDDARLDAGYPARFTTTFAVGNMQEDYTLAYSSQLPVDEQGYGVVAPGQDITQYTPFPMLTGNTDIPCKGVTASGTSLAAPHVTALAGLILSEAYDLGLAIPAKSPARVQWLRRVIIDTARDLGQPGPDAIFGHGLIQADAALAYLQTMR